MIPNFWYAILESDEVRTGAISTCKRMGVDLAFWRDRDGKIVVMKDVCPHRQCKLSPGKLVDGNIQCHFHGFQYNRDGVCQLVPANGRSGPKPKIFQCWTYPCQEAYGLIWVWYGDKRSEYPPLPFFDGLEQHAYSTVRRHWNVDYTRAIENQLDVSHVPFVHARTIGRGAGTLVNGPFTTIENNQIRVWVNNQPDAGLPAMKPSAVPPPDTPSRLRFNFPNVWQNYINDKLSIVALFAPIDDENTLMYVRFYHNLIGNSLLRAVIGQYGKYQNGKVLAEDEAIVTTQVPKKADLDVGERFIPGDRPIALYLQRRRELILEATAPRAGTDLASEAGTLERADARLSD